MLDQFELNKIAGGVLLSFLFLIGIGKFADWIFHVPDPITPGYQVVLAQKSSGEKQDPVETAEPDVPLGNLLASANLDRGAEIARKKCASCHSFDAGGKNKIGPNLHGIAGRAIASHEGYAFSSALQEMGGVWTWENLNAFLTSPKAFAPRTKMSFVGLKKPEDRADLLLYLKQISPDAPPLPQPTQQEEAEIQ